MDKINQQQESSELKLEKGDLSKDVQSENTKMDKKQERKSKTKKVKKKSKITIWIKDIVLGVINVGFIVALIILLSKLPQKARDLNTLRTNSLSQNATDDTANLKFDIENNSEKISKLKKIFPQTDEDLLEFVSQLEAIKLQSTAMEGFTFASKDPVVDKTKNVGIPIIIKFNGSWEEIGNDIKKIEEIPFVFRPISVDAQENPESQKIEVKYGGFLYVDANFKRN